MDIHIHVHMHVHIHRRPTQAETETRLERWKRWGRVIAYVLASLFGIG
jgi:hypothetical protein